MNSISVEYRLPCVFKILPRLESLKVLKLDMLCLLPVKLPMMKLTALETLYMRFIVPNDPIDEWVSQSFPSLKHLSLINVYVKEKDVMKTKQRGLTIRSSCLEELVIHCCRSYKILRVITENLRALSYATCRSGYCYHGFDEDELLLEISAPLLQTFSLKGFPGQVHCEGTFKNLNIASLTQQYRFSSTQLNSYIHLSKALCKGRILHTEMGVLEGLCKITEATISFENIRHVQIQISSWWGYVNDMGDIVSNFLERSLPNLETLTLMSASSIEIDEEEVHEFDEDIVRECGVAERREIKRLRKVELIIREMNERMAFLIGVLKEWCVDLEETILNYPARYHESITRYLESFDMASNYAPLSISFLPVD